MDYALVVGVGKFKNGLESIPFVENDANEFVKVMMDEFRLCNENIYWLVNEQTEYTQILETAKRISQKNDANDRVFIYFATHGKSVYETPYLACYDSVNSYDRDAENWLSAPKLMGVFAEANFNVLAFLDCCQSAYKFSSRGASDTDDETDCNSIKYYSDYVGVFAAARENEKAYPDYEIEHGCWTYHLIKALEGSDARAFKSNTRQITLTSLQEYLASKVTNRVKDLHNEKQTPYFWGGYSGEVIIHEYPILKTDEMKICNIYFGEIDAATERKSVPQSDYFTENFFDLNSISSILTHPRNIQIILGNKGTGKTYIGEYFEDKHKNVIYKNVGSVTTKLINEITHAQENEKGKYRDSWKYIILTIFAISSVKQSLKGASKFKDVLEEIYGKKSEQLFTAQMLRISIVCDKRIKNGIILNDKYDMYMSPSGKSYMSDIVSLYEDILNEEYQEGLQFLFIDGLDEQIRDTISKKFKDIHLDLLDAVDDLHNSLTNVKVVLLMRQDILQLLTGQANLNKLRTARTKELTWLDNSSRAEDTSLYQFVEKRIVTSMNKHGVSVENFSLMSILPKRMSHQHTWDWILELTTYKPRDVIAFFKKCQLSANSEQVILFEENLWDATRTYSDYLWGEFCDNLSGTFLATKTTELLKLLNIISEDHTVQKGVKFSFSDYTDSLNQIENLREISPGELLKLLYEVGMIRVHTKDGKSYWIFREQPIDFSINAWKEFSFEIHKGLWKKTHTW